jgi:ubiquitin C-terminal hydrolase
LHLNQASAQPHSKNPIDATTDNNGINGNVINSSISVWHKELIGAQVTTELDSSASVESFPSPIGERLLHAELINNSLTTPIWDQATVQPTVQPSSVNQHHHNKPSNTISPQHGALVGNNDSDVVFSSGIQKRESDSAAATEQQLYLVENMHASPRIRSEVALAPVQQIELERIVRLAVNKAVQQVSVQRADMINALKRKIKDLQSKILELTQGDIGINITCIATRVQNWHVNFPDGTTHIVKAGIKNIGSMCYLNAYLQVIACCPILPNCLSKTPTLSLRKFPLYCALATLIRSLVSENKMKETVDTTVFFQKFTVVRPSFLLESGSSQLKSCQGNLFQICIFTLWELFDSHHLHIRLTKKTDNVHKFSLQIKESLLAEFDNDDAITSEEEALVHNDMGHFWSRFGSGATTYTYRCNCCQHISQMNTDFMEIILPFPQDRLSISLNDLLNRGFDMEHMDNRLCKNCNNSNTSEATTSIHTHLDILITMLQHNCWNNNSERINTWVNFPVSGFVPNQGLDNDETPTEYNLFAAVCLKESRNKSSGHFTAQCKIKGSNGY